MHEVENSQISYHKIYCIVYQIKERSVAFDVHVVANCDQSCMNTYDSLQ